MASLLLRWYSILFFATLYQHSNAHSNHYVAKGNPDSDYFAVNTESHYCQNDDDIVARYSTYHHNTIGVGCCAPSDNYGYRPDCDAHGATYDDANALCSSYGLRLCTLNEMLSGITQGKGCNYDNAYNWVSDTCVEAGCKLLVSWL